MKILFVGYALPKPIMDEICLKDCYPPVAADKHQWNIVKGIEATSENSIDLISSFPVSEYPGYPRILIGYSKWRHHQNSNDEIVPFINILILKHITKLFSSFILISKWLIKNKQYQQKKILIYEMYSPHLLASISASRLFRGDTVLIVPDLPKGSFRPKNPIKKILKPIISNFLLKTMKLMKGLIVLTHQMAQNYAPQIPFIVVEGIVSLDSTTSTDNNAYLEKDKKIIMFAGLLEEEYGVKLLLDAFDKISDNKYLLWIFGRGAMGQKVKDASRKNSRIVYWGFVPNDEIMRKALNCTVLVNPRPSHRKFTSYSFPSKLLEYMSTGRPAISTVLPGIPKEYYDFIYLLKDESPEALAKLLQEVCSKRPEELYLFGQRAKDFVKEKKNYLHQGQRIYEFLKKL